MKKLLIPLILLTLLLTTTLHASAKTLYGKVISIQDGDTITVLDKDNKQHKIRLAGIDCPEKKQPFGQAAKDFTSESVFGKEVQILYCEKDRYGRILGLVMISKCSTLNKQLLRKGLAWINTKHINNLKQIKGHCRHEQLSKIFEGTQQRAKEREKGLWLDKKSIIPEIIKIPIEINNKIIGKIDDNCFKYQQGTITDDGHILIQDKPNNRTIKYNINNKSIQSLPLIDFHHTNHIPSKELFTQRYIGLRNSTILYNDQIISPYSTQKHKTIYIAYITSNPSDIKPFIKTDTVQFYIIGLKDDLLYAWTRQGKTNNMTKPCISIYNLKTIKMIRRMPLYNHNDANYGKCSLNLHFFRAFNTSIDKDGNIYLSHSVKDNNIIIHKYKVRL